MMEKITVTKDVYMSIDGKIFETEKSCIDWECSIERSSIIKALHFDYANVIKPNYRALFKNNADVVKLVAIIISDLAYDIKNSDISDDLSIDKIKTILYEYLYIYKYDSKYYHNIHACDEKTVFDGDGIYLIECSFNSKNYNIKSPEPICISFMKLSEFIKKCENSL